MIKSSTNQAAVSSKAEKVNKITKETLYKEHPDENAEIFLHSIQKSRASHLKKVQDKDLMFYTTGANHSPSSNNEDFGYLTEEQFKEGLEKGGNLHSTGD